MENATHFSAVCAAEFKDIRKTATICRKREYLQTVGLLLCQLIVFVWCVSVVTQPVLPPCYPLSISFHCLSLSLKSNFKGVYVNKVLVHSEMPQEMQQ